MTILFELLKPKPLNKRLKTFTIKKPHPLSSKWQVFSNSCNRSRKVKTGKNIYIEIFEYFLWQMTLTVTRNKVCILCSNVGSATCHIIKSVCLPDRPEKKIAAVCDLAKNHFKPEISEASLLFYSRSRKNEESVHVFLFPGRRRLAVPCNFGQFVTRA